MEGGASTPVLGARSSPRVASEWTVLEVPALLERVRDFPFWGVHLPRLLRGESRVGVHLGVFAEPFLSDVLSGRKTLESRFSRCRIAPFEVVSPGDVVLIKERSGPIRGIVLVRCAWFFDLRLAPIRSLRERFGVGICARDDYWNDKRDAIFGTVIALGEPAGIAPLGCRKRDRRAWVTVQSRVGQLSLWR